MAIKKQSGNMYDWITHTWNPIKGRCSHICSYCYMAVMAKRFEVLDKPIHLDEKELVTSPLGKDHFIFIGSSTDMWADDVPSDWIHKVLEHCRQYQGNRYLFQTKNPARFFEFLGAYPVNTLLGTTIETDDDSYRAMDVSKAPGINARVKAMGELSGCFDTMITVEPVLDFTLDPFIEQIKTANPKWVNIGADSGRHKLPEPGADKIRGLISELEKFTDVKEKTNLERLFKNR